MKRKKVVDLRAVIGSYGVKTRKYQSVKSLIYAAKILFALSYDITTKDEALAAINRMSKSERGRAANRNRHRLENDPPAHGNRDHAAEPTKAEIERHRMASEQLRYCAMDGQERADHGFHVPSPKQGRKTLSGAPLCRDRKKTGRRSRRKVKSAIQYQDMVLPLTSLDRRQLSDYLPRLRQLHASANERGVPWASCYEAQIDMVEEGLRKGRM